MNKKTIFSGLLLLSIFSAGCSSQSGSSVENTLANTVTEQQTGQSEVTKTDKIEIIDFHATRRCFSCQTVEAFARATLEEFFQPELRDGKITFQSINVEEAENQAIAQKYQASGSALFVNVISNGVDHISEEATVWRLVRDELAFKEYFKNKIETLLDSKI